MGRLSTCRFANLHEFGKGKGKTEGLRPAGLCRAACLLRSSCQLSLPRKARPGQQSRSALRNGLPADSVACPAACQGLGKSRRVRFNPALSAFLKNKQQLPLL